MARVRGRVKMLLGGGDSYPDPMAAPPLRWMKAPRPAVVTVTNLLRFSARLEARGRGPRLTIKFPPPLPQHLNTRLLRLTLVHLFEY